MADEVKLDSGCRDATKITNGTLLFKKVEGCGEVEADL